MSSVHPSVTVIMVIRNEQAFIERSLGSVLGQEYPAEKLQVLVVDGMSSDRTRQIVERMRRTSPQVDLSVLDNPRGIFPTGFNIGLRNAGGDLVMMMGGHTVLAPDYLARCVDHLQRFPEIDCVGGYLETVADSAQGRAIALAMSSRFGVGGVAFRTRSDRVAEVDTVAFGVYRRAALDLCGPMDEELVRDQDDEYNYRLRALGGRILIAPEIRARYYSRGSIRSLWKQYFEYGLWKVRVLQKHPRQMRPRQFVPPVFVLFLLLSALLAGSPSPLLRLAALIVPAAYAAANLAASVSTASRHGWTSLPLLPPVYAILHIGYGLGFLTGLVRFSNRWGDRLGRTPSQRSGHA